MANPAPPPTQTRKSVTGFVTKLVGDGATYGFINDEIFFQQTNVTDGPASSGDRVFAECEYSELLPIKWNATSIKIIGRASTGPSNNILDSDPRRQSRQGLLNQQQPGQAAQNPSISAPNTYQQPRQQRQTQQHDININQLPTPTPVQQPHPVMSHDQTNMNQQPEFFSPFAQPPPQLPDLQPFQNDIPMGPPKLEYTSQLGSAFVQNQFMAGPLLPQQPTQQSMLPQHQPQPQQQQHQQQQQQQHQRQQPNHRDQKGVRDTNVKGRFNDKNDRNQSNRGRNRTDKKYEQPRSVERDNSANIRSSRSGDSRDRSSGHGDARATKRDDSTTNSRQSPVSHTARPTNSASSDRGHSKHTPRRHYEPQNIPKTSILSNLNGWNMRSRCSSSVHVPSDLKNVIINAYQRLDIKNMPKPITFKIDQSASGNSEDTKSAGSDKSKPGETDMNADVTGSVIAESTANEDVTSQSSTDNKVTEQITPPSSRSDAKLNHKYGVKVLLISLPELESIYKKVFGPDFDSYSNESKMHSRLDEAISLLCNKSSNGGHSLIGGKFDPTLDGFVEGEINEFERYGKQPDLIATCRRVVQEQTGLDLGPCQGWTLISTFLYNNKSDYFSSKSSVEYSFIYLPHIWSMVVNDLTNNSGDKETLQINTASPTEQADTEVASTVVPKVEVEEITAVTHLDPEVVKSDVNDDATSVEIKQSDEKEEEEEANCESVADETTQACLVNLENISDLKVVDLKLELDKRDIKYKPNAKKAELALILQESLTLPSTEKSEHTQNTGETQSESTQDDNSGVQDQVRKGELVTNDESATHSNVDATMANTEIPTDVADTNKRKSDEMDGNDEPETKKIRNDSEKLERVDLIKEAFVVKSRPGQTQLSTLSLHDAVQVSKYDQFELSVASSILKESLVQHLSEYIFTTLVEDSRQKSKEMSDSVSTASSVSNSQETANSDTNNNSTAAKQAAATASAAVTNQTSVDKVNLIKEYPVDRYINLAFAYFDSSHMGYIHADDLFRLFNNTGLTISKRALWSLIGEGDKFNYRTLPDLSPKFPPNHVYRFPDQFNCLPGLSTTQTNNGLESQQSSANKMIEYQGVKYEVEKLIHQVRDAEMNQVNMVQRFNDAISKHDKQEAEIHALEVSQLSLSKSIKALNSEISDLKREKLTVDKRVESLKKQIKEAIKTLSE